MVDESTKRGEKRREGKRRGGQAREERMRQRKKDFSKGACRVSTLTLLSFLSCCHSSRGFALRCYGEGFTTASRLTVPGSGTDQRKVPAVEVGVWAGRSEQMLPDLWRTALQSSLPVQSRRLTGSEGQKCSAETCLCEPARVQKSARCPAASSLVRVAGRSRVVRSVLH
jgi:hypothetical protein